MTKNSNILFCNGILKNEARGIGVSSDVNGVGNENEQKSVRFCRLKRSVESGGTSKKFDISVEEKTSMRRPAMCHSVVHTTSSFSQGALRTDRRIEFDEGFDFVPKVIMRALRERFREPRHLDRVLLSSWVQTWWGVGTSP